MVWALKGKKREWTISAFQHLVSSSMREEIIGKSSKSLGGLHTLYIVGVGSHLSSQMCISFPFPTLYLEPLLMTSKLLNMLRQAYGGLLPSFALMTSP